MSPGLLCPDRSGKHTENGEVEDEYKLVVDGDCADSGGSELANHEIVQKADKISNSHLNHYWNGNAQHHFIKCSIFFMFENHCVAQQFISPNEKMLSIIRKYF